MAFESIARADTQELSQPSTSGTVRAADSVSAAIALAIALFAVPIAILASRRMQRVLLAIMVVSISLQVEKHFLLQENAAELGSLGGLQISLTNIALAGLYVAWLVRIVVRSGSFTPQRQNLSKATFLPAALLLLFYAISLLVANDTTLGVFEVWSVLELFCLYLYIAKTVSSREDVLFIVRVLLIGLIIQSSLMLAQVGGLLGDIQFYGIKARAEFAGDTRISGTIGAPNQAAAYLAMMMVVALGVMFANVGRTLKYLAGISFALATVPFIFTLSRGGWISLFVALSTLAIAGWRRLPRKIVVVCIVATTLLTLPFKGAIEERLYSDDRGSAASRMPLNNLAGVMIADHPLLGVGANNFAVAMRPYLSHGFAGDFVFTVHNQYLLIWAETGIGGLIAFVWFLVAIVRQGSKCWQSKEILFAPLALGCISAILGFTVQMLFDLFRGGAALHLIWLLGGLLTAMFRVSSNGIPNSQSDAITSTRLVPVGLARP